MSEEPRKQPALNGVREHLLWLWSYWRPHSRILIALTLFTLISTAVAVSFPLALGWVTDRLREFKDQEDASTTIGKVLLVLALVAFGRFVVGFYPATRALMNLWLDRDIREHVFARLMKKDYRFNNAFRTGDVVTRLTDDIYEFPKISWFACSGIFRAIESSSKLLFCLGVMLYLNWKLTLVSVIPLPLMMWLFYALRHKIHYYMKKSQECISKTNDLLESAFSGIRIVKTFRAEEGQQKRLAELMTERRAAFLGKMKIETALWSLDTMASRVGQAIVIAVGGVMVAHGDETIGTLMSFYFFLQLLAHPMMDIPHLFMTGQQAFVSIDRVQEIRSFPVTVERPSGDCSEEIEEIAFDDVSFTYDQTRNCLDNTSFRVPAGSRVAVVGPVASGKSTLLKVLAGVLIPQEGEILFNGKSVRQWDWESYRQRIGYVPQEGVLFSSSVQENVIFGREDSAQQADPEQWARRCLSVAQMDEDLKIFPDGLETDVGQKGLLVSGGQKQRIAIARALAGRPKILLLDDCTAALDAHNEDRFWSQLDKEFGGVTCFIVSHRLATIRRADRILVLEEGRITDQGSHEELAGRCPTYKEFLIAEDRKAHLEAASGSAESS